LAKRLQSYGEVIQPQMTQIAELLPYAGLDPQLTRVFLTDLEAIAAGARMVRRDMLSQATLPQLPTGDVREALLELSTAAARMHQTTDRIFHELGRRFRTDVRAELRAALDQTREGTPGVEIRAEIPERLPPVFALKGELSNILENLITNAAVAARGNRSELPPRVVVGAHLDGGLLIITVTDSGAGIAPEQIETLFESRTADPTQHGRGLPYARRRLRLFDGKIDVMQSTAEEGTVVAVTLRPLEVAPERQPARTPQTAPEKQPPALETRPDEQPTPSEEE
jgi:signal transduction histidine kinase